MIEKRNVYRHVCMTVEAGKIDIVYNSTVGEWELLNHHGKAQFPPIMFCPFCGEDLHKKLTDKKNPHWHLQIDDNAKYFICPECEYILPEYTAPAKYCPACGERLLEPEGETA